jgi:hypothetical protein
MMRPEATSAKKKRNTRVGPSGPAGPQGPAGAQGPAPSSLIRFGPESENDGTFVESKAACQPGEHAVGGGFDYSLIDTLQIINFVSSVPDPFLDGVVPTGWVAGVNAEPPGGAKQIRAYVICVPD